MFILESFANVVKKEQNLSLGVSKMSRKDKFHHLNYNGFCSFIIWYKDNNQSLFGTSSVIKVPSKNKKKIYDKDSKYYYKPRLEPEFIFKAIITR